jgi:inner membrane protein
MTAPTHVTFAEFVYLLLLTTMGVALSWVNGVTIAVSSVLADLDTGASWIGRLLKPLSLRIERRFGHRTLTHSLLFIAGLAVVLYPLATLSGDLYACVLVGYATHLLLDTMNVTGVNLFYPFSTVRCVFPFDVNQPGRYRVQTRSAMDSWLGIFFSVACIPTLFVSSQGYERFIRFTQKNIESAVRDYNEFSRTHLVYADISAHNLLTKEHVVGRFEIVGALDSRTLLFRGKDSTLHSLGEEYHAEYVAESAICERGPQARVRVRQIDMANQTLAGVQELVDPGRENQFFGELSTADQFALFRERNEFSPVTGSAGTLRLNYAFYSDIKKLGLENLFITRGILSVRTVTAGAEPDTLETGTPSGSPFVRVSFQVDPREPLELLCRQGETVMKGDLLARWGSLLDYRKTIELNERRIEVLMAEHTEKIRLLEEKITAAESAHHADSVGFAVGKEMLSSGLASQGTVRRLELKLAASRLAYVRLRMDARFLVAKTGLEVRRLRNENDKLAQKEKAMVERSESRSPVRGEVLEIRQSVHGSKLTLLIVLKVS